RQERLRTQQQSEQQPAYATIAIPERMDRFELVVNQREPNQRRQSTAFLMKEFLKTIESFLHLRNRRRNVGGVLQPAASRSDEVLRTTEPSGKAVPADFLHQALMQLTNEPEAYRKLLQTVQAVLERDNVVGYFENVFGRSLVASRHLCG